MWWVEMEVAMVSPVGAVVVLASSRRLVSVVSFLSIPSILAAGLVVVVVVAVAVVAVAAAAVSGN